MHSCPLLPEGYEPEYPAVTAHPSDGETLTVGGVPFTFFHTPGHTPGCASLIFPVHDHGTEHTLCVWGGMNPPKDEAGKREYRDSAEKFLAECTARSCDVEMSIHPFADHMPEKLAALAERTESAPHPMVTGALGVQLFMGVVINDIRRRLTVR